MGVNGRTCAFAAHKFRFRVDIFAIRAVIAHILRNWNKVPNLDFFRIFLAELLKLLIPNKKRLVRSHRNITSRLGFDFKQLLSRVVTRDCGDGLPRDISIIIHRNNLDWVRQFQIFHILLGHILNPTGSRGGGSGSSGSIDVCVNPLTNLNIFGNFIFYDDNRCLPRH